MRNQNDVRSEVQTVSNGVFHSVGKLIDGGSRCGLKLQPEVRQTVLLTERDSEFHDFRELPEYSFNRRRVHIVPADDQHLVAAAQHSAFQTSHPAAAFTFPALESNPIACPVSNDRRSRAAEICKDEFTFDFTG